MFAKSITNSDEFIDMPDSAQNLYFHLSMNADDDGFVNNWKNIMRMTGHKEDDMKILIAKQYIIPFDSGVIVIRHWRINNYLRGDRYTETQCKAEKLQLQVDENLVYQLATSGIPGGIPGGIPRLGKVRLGKDIPPITPQGDECVDDTSSQIRQIVDYLNEKTGCSYKASTDDTRKKIKARLNEGFAAEDFEKVIDSKVADWGNNFEMRKYLRPSTLFGNKFESYLQNAKRAETSAQELGYNVE